MRRPEGFTRPHCLFRLLGLLAFVVPSFLAGQNTPAPPAAPTNLTIVGVDGIAPVSAVKTCGPPAFACSRTDQTVIQPDAGQRIDFGGVRGANRVVTDPIYNNVKITRCTDGNSNPGNVNASYLAGLGGSAQKNIWNVDDRLLLIGDLNGNDFIFRFNPDALTCSPVTNAGGQIYSVRPGVFSKADAVGGPYTYYAYQYPKSFEVSPVVIPAKGIPVVKSPVADFTPALHQSGVPAWPGTGQAVTLGAVIKPTRNNPAGHLFQTINGGITSLAEPDWSTTAIPSQNGKHKIVDGSITWTNVGNSFSSSPFVDIGGVEKSDQFIAESVSLDGGQDTGTWAMVYDRNANVIYQYNTWSGVETDYTCTGGSGYNCAGGSWIASVVGIVSAPDRFVWHENQLGFSGKYFVLVDSNCTGCVHAGSTAYEQIWQYGTATLIPMVPYGTGHMVAGNSYIANEDGAADYYAIRRFSNVAAYYPMWAPDPCTDTSQQPNPPYSHPPCSAVLDSHLSWTYNKGQDQEPIIGAGDIGATFTNHYPAVSPWQYEIIGISTCGSSPEQPSCPTGYPTNTVWRFGRTFNFGTELNHNDTVGNFYSAISSGTGSQTGRYYADTSTGNGTMGSTSGGPSCHGGFSWSRKFSYAADRQITPVDYQVSGSNYNNPGLYTFQPSAACTSGNSEPSWSQDGVTPVSDGTCTWKPAGVANCRSDVLIFGLQ